MVMINKLTLNNIVNRDTSTYVRIAVDSKTVQWEDIFDYFSTHSIRGVELFNSTGRIPVPMQSRYYQDREFIINQIAKGSLFSLTQQHNFTPLLFEIFSDINDFFVEKVINICINGCTNNEQHVAFHDEGIYKKILIQLDGVSNINVKEQGNNVHESPYNVTLEPQCLLYMHENTQFNITSSDEKSLYLYITIK